MAKKKLTKAQLAAKKKAAQKAAAEKARKAQETAWNVAHKPKDWLKGSVTPGKEYTAWKTYSGKKPDLGKGAGPGDPYRESKKKVPYIKPAPPKYTPPASKTKPSTKALAMKAKSQTVAMKAKSRVAASTPKPSNWVAGKPASWAEGRANDFKSQAIERRLKGVK